MSQVLPLALHLQHVGYVFSNTTHATTSVTVALVTVGVSPDAINRRPVTDVLGIMSGPSRRGSTYWSRPLHCPFEHYLANELGWRSKMPSDPLDTGLIWHHALEVYYREALRWQDHFRTQDPNLDLRDPYFLRAHDPAAQRLAYEAVVPVSREPGYEHIWDKLEVMLHVYFERWQGDRWEIVDVETTIDCPFEAGLGFEYSSRLDLFVVDHQLVQPMLRVIEHKSAYRLDSNVLEGYTQDLQTLGQVWLAATRVNLDAYPPFVGSLVNITSKTKEPGCDRVPLSPSPTTLATWESSMRRQTKLLPIYKELDWPKNYANCTRRYGRCEFFNLCRAHPHITPTDAAKMTEQDTLPDGFRRDQCAT